ncbi:MAG: tetratricopeptide repeat protein [Pyrinomonadaceae bacterium]
MKRCPECRRDYYDDTLSFCLEDGTPLVQGSVPVSQIAADEAATVTLPSFAPGEESPTAVMQAIPVLSGEVGVSIAVLPFAHLSSSPDDEYFCDGLAEELLNALAKIDGLKVAARTSAFSFKGKDTEISEIGQKLGVRNILEGSVRKSGDRLRITVQLVNASDGYHVWSERYDREMRDIFDVQDEITLAVVDALKLKLFGDVKSAVLKKATENAEAHELYLRGRALWSRRTYPDFTKAIRCFERAIELDPIYASAYAGLADCYTFLAYFEACSPGEMEPKVRLAVEKAIELGPALAECHSSLAIYKTFFEFDIDYGEKELRKAIAINPNSSLAHYWLCSVLAALARFEESIAEGKLALKLDPLSPVVNATLARALCCAGQYDKAIELSYENFELLPDFFFSHWVIGWAYGQKGDLGKAIDHFRMAVKDSGLTIYGYLGKALVKAGQTDEARGLLNELEEQTKHRYVSPVASAVILAELGEMPKALDMLEKARQLRAIHLMWTRCDPIFEVFRSEPKFQEICEKIERRK